MYCELHIIEDTNCIACMYACVMYVCVCVTSGLEFCPSSPIYISFIDCMQDTKTKYVL